MDSHLLYCLPRCLTVLETNRKVISVSKINQTGTKAKFNWADPLLLEQQLTEDERMICDAARSYAQDKLAPRVLEAFRHESTDPAIFREMGELGLLGVTIPGHL